MLESKEPHFVGESSFSSFVSYLLRVITVLIVGAVLMMILLVKGQPMLSKFAQQNICPSNPTFSFCHK